MYFYGLIIPVLSFFLQVWPKLMNKTFGVDTWRHLMIADYIRKHRSLPKDMEHKYIVPAPFGYPPVFRIFLALFTKKFTEKYHFIFSPIIDSISNFIFFLAALFLTKDITSAIIAQTIALSTPITVIEAAILNPRTLSYLVFYLSFFSLLTFNYNGNLFFLFFAAVMLLVLLYTHKFAVQAYAFSLIGFSILERNVFYVLFFLSVLGIAFILGGKLYRIIFEDHLVTMDIFRKFYDFRLHQFRKKQKENDKEDFIARLYKLSFKNPLAYIIGNNPWLVIFLSLYFLISLNLIQATSNINDVFLTKLNIWVFILLTCGFLILSVKKIKFLGEGNRYIEYTVMPLAIVLGSYFPSMLNNYKSFFLVPFLFFLICMIGGIIYIQKKVILEDKYRSINPNLWKVIDYLKLHGNNNIRIAFFPTSLGDPVMYFIEGKALLTDCAKGVKSMRDVLPVVLKPMKEIISKYKLNYILIDETYVTFEELKLKKYRNIKDFGESYKLIYL